MSIEQPGAGPRTVASTIASGRNGITRNHSVSRNRLAADPAGEVPDGDADQGADHHRDQRGGEADEQRDPRAPDQQRQDRAAVLVGARAGTRRTAGCSGSPGGRGDVEARARRPAAGAKSATSDEEDQDAEPEHAGPVAAGTAARRRGRTRGAAPGQRPRRAAWRTATVGVGELGGRAHAAAPAGRAAGRTGRRPGWRRSPPAENSRNMPCSTGKSGTFERLVGQQAEARDREHRLDRDRAGDHEARG